MLRLRDWILTFTLVVSFPALSQNDLPARANELMHDGIAVNEALMEFLNAHQCELGMIKGCDRPLSLKEIKTLKNLFIELDDWKKGTFEEIMASADFLNGKEFKLTTGPHKIKEIAGIIYVSLNALDVKSKELLLNAQITSSSALLMYDSFFRLSQILAKAKKIRSVLETDMGEEGKVLHETFAVAMDQKLWSRTRLYMAFLNLAAKIVPVDQNLFEQYIQSSFTGSRIKEDAFVFRMKSVLFMNRVFTSGQFMDAIERVMGKLSRIFGNSAGKVQTRDGKLKKLADDQFVMKKMKQKLRPLDIFFEKTPFRLTDKFIPGFYGHVAIWLGRPGELMSMTVQHQGREIPLIEHPKVLPYLAQMSQGELVVEALRAPGVTMNTLEHFMDIDDFLVLRPNDVRSPGEHILRLLEQIGKPYDFNFDVETEQSIVCSELVYQVFDEYEWPVSRSMGRFTMSPDHVAWKGIDSCFVPVVMYHDGIEIRMNMVKELKSLLLKSGGISYTPVGNCR